MQRLDVLLGGSYSNYQSHNFPSEIIFGKMEEEQVGGSGGVGWIENRQGAREGRLLRSHLFLRLMAWRPEVLNPGHS